ncbi:uncharacterized protein LOC131670328 [Phymastichus coffea]|uniref:uncharacterized protein LOC131670328 n=1 Tax=Phymastichus coffea TaxID=108790 RepID=UPI00273C0026|nr:uncharacterized protein LOC131670328 [Phymastichus coffea]
MTLSLTLRKQVKKGQEYFMAQKLHKEVIFLLSFECNFVFCLSFCKFNTRALDKTTKKLETKRNDYHDKRKIVQEQWKDLAQKEAICKRNQEKKERAAIKIVEQNQLKEKRQIQIEELMEKCKEISDTKLKMDKNIAKYQIYEEFLLKVIEKEESMQTINDLLMRYEALVAAKKELNDVQQRDIMKLEKAKSSLNHLIEKYSVKVATLNNRIDCSKQRYEHAQHESAKWEKVFQNIQSETTEILLDVVTIKDTCRRMYMEICRRKNLKTCYTNKVEKQLLIIKQTIGEFEIINRKIKDIEELRMKLIEEKNFVIMGLNNQIAKLQARYENTNIKALESEELVTEIKNNAVKQMEKSTQ